MQRREVLSLLGVTALSSLLTSLSAQERIAVGEALHARLAGSAGAMLRALDGRQSALVGALADTILPRTDTPGATDVGVTEFVDLLLAEWYPQDERDEFLAGLDALDQRCRATKGLSFPELDAAGREAFLATVDGKEGEKKTPEATYARLKHLTIYGYFTSKQVATEVLQVKIIPGRFDGCVPLGQS